MKFLNDFKNIFAVLGIVSIIFWICASDSTSNDSSSNLPPQLTGGTYQVEYIQDNGSAVGGLIVVLNTETGVMKTYYRSNSTKFIWTENNSDGIDRTITFTH